MGERERTNSPQREQTDESLRDERSKADVRFEETREAIEDEADAVLRTARQRAGDVIKSARNDADRKDAGNRPSREADARSKRLRDQEDAALDREHITADAVLRREREAQRRYLADFLAVERSSTDADLDDERAHIDAMVEARDAVLATVSHDVRTLLGGLSINTELVMANAPEGESGEKLRKYAGMSRRLIAQLNRLISDLLDVASIEVGQFAVIPEDVDLAEILRDTFEAFEPLAAARKVTLDAEPPRRSLRVRLDTGRILQVLANLISNALKFTSEGGKVSIRARPEGDDIHFVVSDTGAGIPADELERIFERFRQVGKDHRGVGLGLFISKGIVEAHGGRMWAESEAGSGSTFHFVLPASGSPPQPGTGAGRDDVGATKSAG